MTNLLDNLTQLSPPAALAVALWVLGGGIKKSPVQNWLIPFILPILGAIIYPFVADTAKVSHNVQSPMLFNALIGMGIGGTATAMDQMIWQFVTRTKNLDGKTSFLTHENSPPAPPPAAP